MEVIRRIAQRAQRYTYYKLLHDLEKIGCHGPRNLKVRPLAAKVFPARDIYDVRLPDADEGGDARAEVVAWFGGLYGVDSPLPMYFDDIIEEDSQRGRSLKLLLELVGGRFYQMLYEIWSRMAPMFCGEEALDGQVRRPVLSMCGLGHMKGARVNMVVGAAYLAQGLRTRWGLEAMLNSVLGIPVAVHEFDAARVNLRDSERTRLGNRSTAVLGRSFRATPYRESIATHIRIVCGPLERDAYVSMLPGGELHRVLTYLAFRYLPTDLEYRLELVLAASAVRDLDFGLGSRYLRLGATTVLGANRIRRNLHIVRDGVSTASRPAELRKVIAFIESREDDAMTQAEVVNHGETSPSVKSA